MENPVLPGILITAVVSAALYSWHKLRQSVPLPPGPKGHLIFGKALDVANASVFWLKFAEYADQYGPIISVRMLHQYTFIVSDPGIASELFEKRAANYSDKEVEMGKLIGWDTDVLLLQYGPKLKRYRTMLNRALNNRVALDYISLQQHEVQRFMKRLIEEPSEFMDHVRLLAASIAVRIGYGYKVKSFSDRFVQTAEKHMEGFSECLQPWGWAVNIFPPLRYLPNWLPFQRRALQAKRIFTTHREEPFAYVQDQMAAGTAEDSFTSKLLYSEDGTPMDDETKEHIKARVPAESIAATLYAAGSDTTVSAVQSFFLAITLYPEVQAKAQAEIAAYLESRLISDGSRAMISPADRPHLPYTSALVRELLRWHPIVPMVGHRSSHEDDNNVISGGKTYRIPARSGVIVNVWKILHNPDVYEKPEQFMPERYLVANPPPDPESYVFGFGRRICPGMHVAQQSINVLANFTIIKAKDENGVETTPQEHYSGGLISHPLPFICSITPKDGCKEWLQEVLE